MHKVLIIFLLFTQFCFSQLGKSESEILKRDSSNYFDKTKRDKFTVHKFAGEVTKLNGETCAETIAYYIDNNTKLCFKESYVFCSQASHNYVNFFNSVAVQIEPLKWKDFENNTIYTLKVVDEYSYAEHYYDYDNSFAEVVKIYDNVKLLSQAKKFFKDYIPLRLSELDEYGYASEYEEARDYHIGDINLDGIPDVVVIYTVEGFGGGNIWARYILVLTNNGEKISGYQEDFAYGKFQGGSEFLGIKDGYAIFKRGESECCGFLTIWEIIGFGIRNEKLVEINYLDENCLEDQ